MATWDPPSDAELDVDKPIKAVDIRRIRDLSEAMAEGAAGAPPVGRFVEGTKQSTTSGTAKTFASIPAGSKEINICLDGVSLSGSDDIIVQIGDAGGIEITGYASGSGDHSGSITATAGFIMKQGASGAFSNGSMSLTLMEAASNLWVGQHGAGQSGVGAGGGRKALSAELTQVRLTVTGANSFDAGAVNITYR